jgi:GntR family transcriptional regulator
MTTFRAERATADLPSFPAALEAGLPGAEPSGSEPPLHVRLKNAIEQAIDRSGLGHGERIWTENQLMRRYGVSRYVVRQALNHLVLEGRLSVRKGSGYFINRRRVRKHLPVISSFTADLAASGERYSVELLEVGMAAATGEAEHELAAVPGRPRVHRVRRIGRLDDEAVALLDGAYPTAMAKVLTRRAVASDGVYATLKRHGRHPHHAEVVLGVGFVSGREAELLEVGDGTAVVRIVCRMFTEHGELIEVTRELYRTDRFEFGYSAGLVGAAS